MSEERLKELLDLLSDALSLLDEGDYEGVRTTIEECIDIVEELLGARRRPKP